jgi:hypothetical protein
VGKKIFFLLNGFFLEEDVMQGFGNTPVRIAGNSLRPSIFATSIADGRGLHAKPSMGAAMGQQGTSNYERAKRQVSKFDMLLETTRKIANKPVREEIFSTYVGDPENQESGIYKRNGVASDLAEAEAYTPVNALVFTKSTVASRLDRLDDWNERFERAAENAEATWGLLPEPVVIERERIIIQAGAAPAWVTPVLVVGAAVAGAALLGLFD